jgi:hypothetical protein
VHGFGQKWSENDGKSAMKPRKMEIIYHLHQSKSTNYLFFSFLLRLNYPIKKNNGKP